MQDCYKKFIESASGYLYLCSINGGETGGLFLAFLMTVLSKSFFPFVGCDFMSFSFLSARHTLVFFLMFIILFDSRPKLTECF